MSTATIFSDARVLTLIAVTGLAVFQTGSAAQQIQLGEPAKQPTQSRDVIIRLEEKGGILRPESTQLPEWSLYRDNEVIWTDDGPPTPGFTRRVRLGRVTPDEVRQLLNFAQQVGFWDLASYYEPPHQTSADGKTVTLNPGAMPDQLSSMLTVQWEGRLKQVTVYPADWQGAPAGYRNFRDRLLQTRPSAAREFQPRDFRLIVERVSSDVRNADTPWPFANVDLSNVGSSPLKLSREEGLTVAELLRNGRRVVVQSGQSFSLQLYADPPRDP